MTKDAPDLVECVGGGVVVDTRRRRLALLDEHDKRREHRSDRVQIATESTRASLLKSII
jgi:hypothetical protein